MINNLGLKVYGSGFRVSPDTTVTLARYVFGGQDVNLEQQTLNHEH
jgi:hypothetical protein